MGLCCCKTSKDDPVLDDINVVRQSTTGSQGSRQERTSIQSQWAQSTLPSVTVIPPQPIINEIGGGSRISSATSGSERSNAEARASIRIQNEENQAKAMPLFGHIEKINNSITANTNGKTFTDSTSSVAVQSEGKINYSFVADTPSKDQDTRICRDATSSIVTQIQAKKNSVTDQGNNTSYSCVVKPCTGATSFAAARELAKPISFDRTSTNINNADVTSSIAVQDPKVKTIVSRWATTNEAATPSTLEGRNVVGNGYESSRKEINAILAALERARKTRKKVTDGRDIVLTVLHSLRVPHTPYIPNIAAYKVEPLDPKSTRFVRHKLFSNAKFNELYEITQVVRVWNPYLMVQYMLNKKKYGYKFKERHLYHGTSKNSVDSILTHNFDWRMVNESKFGKGVYFANNPYYASHYSKKKQSGSSGDYVMIVAKVLVEDGDLCRGFIDTVVPEKGHTTTNNDRQVLTKYDDGCFYPEFVVYFRSVKQLLH